jgi:phosphatidylglycerophosphatase A
MRKGALGPVGRFLITSGGLGFLRPASGTWGSMPPVALAALLLLAGIGPGFGFWPWLGYHAVLVLVLILFTLVCLMLGDAAEAQFDRKDPGQVVADETAAMCIPLMFLPPESLSTFPRAAATLLVAFLAFRIFDILKLPPANRLQSIPGGLGIVIDDLVAGVHALIVTQLFAHLVA